MVQHGQALGALNPSTRVQIPVGAFYVRYILLQQVISSKMSKVSSHFKVWGMDLHSIKFSWIIRYHVLLARPSILRKQARMYQQAITPISSPFASALNSDMQPYFIFYCFNTEFFQNVIVPMNRCDSLLIHACLFTQNGWSGKKNMVSYDP